MSDEITSDISTLTSCIPAPVRESPQPVFFGSEGWNGTLQQSGTVPSGDPNAGGIATLSTVSESLWTLRSDVGAMRETLDTMEAQAWTNQQALNKILDALQHQGALGNLTSQEKLRTSATMRKSVRNAETSLGKTMPDMVGDFSEWIKHDPGTGTASVVMFMGCEQTPDLVKQDEPEDTREFMSNVCAACGAEFPSDATDAQCEQCGKTRISKRRSSIRRQGTVKSLHFDHCIEAVTPKSPRHAVRHNDVGTCRGRFISFSESHTFEAISAFIIISHTLFIGAWVEYMATVSTQGHFVLTVGNVLLTGCFLGEIAVKVVAEGSAYLTGHERGWNVFDLCLLSLVFIEVGFGFAIRGKAIESAKQILKVAEMVRAARVLRIFRVLKFSKTLTMILIQIINTLASLGWILVMSFMMVFTISVCFTMGALSLVSPDADDAAVDMTLRFNDIYHYFGTVHASLFTISAAVSGGYQWAKVASVMHHMGWFYQALFVLFVGIFTITVLNIITGIFVDNALNSNHELTSERERKKEQVRSMRLRDIFSSMDATNKGLITEEDFLGMAHDPDMITLMGELKISQENAGSLFKLLDFDENGELDIHEFVSGLLRLKSNSTSLDVQTLLYEGKKMKEILAEGTVFTWRCFQELGDRLTGLESRLASIKHGVTSRASECSFPTYTL